MAASNCGIQTGYTYPCRTNQGGIKAIYIGLFNDTAMTFTFVGSTLISGISGAVVPFYTVAQRLEQGSLINTLVQSIDNGTTYWDQSVEIVIEQVDSNLTNWINTLAIGHWRVIVQDNNGSYWMVGLKNGVYVTVASGGPHKAYADGNKTTLTFSGREPLELMQIETDVALTVIV